MTIGFLTTQALYRYLGDTSALLIVLTNPDTGAAFDPTNSTLIFTLKVHAWDLDSAAVVQKISTIGGFSALGVGTATVALLPADFAAINSGMVYQFDIQAQNTVTGAVQTVARGTFLAEIDVTKLTSISIPTYTASPLMFGYIINRLDLLGTVGGASYIDGIATVGLSKTVPTAILCGFTGRPSIWIYEPGSTPTGNGVVQPLDYNASTNAGQWTQKL